MPAAAGGRGAGGGFAGAAFVHPINPIHPIMSNWCQNHLTVTGATPEFCAWLADHSFSFEKMNPPPTTHGSRTSDKSGWLEIDRLYTAWGTKWDLDDTIPGVGPAVISSAC